MLHHTVRLGRVIAGAILLVVGVFLSLPFVPGPGIVLVVVGLSLLSHEFEWARRLRDWGHQVFDRYTGRRHAE